MKKLLCMLLSCTMVLSLCVGTVWAANSIPADLESVCTEEEWQVLKLTNRERLANGQTPLTTFPALQSAAGVREQELRSRYSHTRPNKTEWLTALTEGGLGYQIAGENIAAGHSFPSNAVKSWMNSEDHRANMLDSRYTHMGMGYTPKACTIITETSVGQIRNGWVQLFMNDNCTFSEFSLSRQSAYCSVGTSLDDLDLYAQVTCSVHGTCYLPVLSEMCTGFDSETTGLQTVTVAFADQTAQLQVFVSEELPDTSSADSWAVDWINRADALSLLSERNRSEFTTNVTRLQFADLAVTLAEILTGNPIVPVPDTAFTDTTEEVILKAKAAGIASGYPVEDTFEFRPENPITRQEICVMLAQTTSYVNSHRDTPITLDPSEVISGTFLDVDTVADWAVKQVALMTNNNVMGGKATPEGILLAPLDNTTVQEAITLIVKLYDIHQ